MVELSYLLMTVGKTTALTMWTFVGKVVSLLNPELYNSKSYVFKLIFPTKTMQLTPTSTSVFAVLFEILLTL